MVIAVHISNFFKVNTTLFFPDTLVSFLSQMNTGVSLFFIVSAFTLCISHERRKTEYKATTKFFIRRFFRIAPSYYLAIAVIMTWNALTISPDYMKAIPTFWFLSNLLFLNTLSPEIIGTIVPGGWSVSVEFMFYLLFPFITRKVKNANTSLILFCITVAIASLFYFKFHADPYWSRFEFMKLNFYIHLPIFFLGIFIYYVIRDGFQSIKYSTLLAIMALVILFTIIPMPYYMLWCIVFTMVVLILHSHSYKFLCNKVLSKIGEVSFSMYIIHFLIIIILNKFNIGHIISVTGLLSSIINFVLLYTLVAIATFGIANITYKLIEVPGQNLGRKIIKKIDQQNKITV